MCLGRGGVKWKNHFKFKQQMPISPSESNGERAETPPQPEINMFQLHRERAGAEWDLCCNSPSSTSPSPQNIFYVVVTSTPGGWVSGRWQQIAPTSTSIITTMPDNGENEIWWQISTPSAIRIPQSWHVRTCVNQCVRGVQVNALHVKPPACTKEIGHWDPLQRSGPLWKEYSGDGQDGREMKPFY